MLRLLCGLLVAVVLRAPVGVGQTCRPPEESAVTRVLLDTYNFAALFPPWTSVGDPVTWELSNVEQCLQTVAACNAATRNNLLVTPFILAPVGVTEISIFVEYICPISESSICNTNVSLHIYETVAADQSASVTFSNYVSISALVPNDTRIPHSLRQPGFYLAFRDALSCVEITRVRVLYRECPETVNALVRYPDTSSGTDSNGTCVRNAVVNTGPLIAQCSFEQEMFIFTSSGSCHCSPGFERSNNECTACVEGSFKATAGDAGCDDCPVNSNNQGVNNTDCTCEVGYNSTTGCSECAVNFFINGSNTCSQCPAGSSSSGGMAEECRCNSMVATMNGAFNTTSMDCTVCRSDHLRSAAGMCMSCPAMSSRDFDRDESVCFCVDNRATASNAPNTSEAACVGCTMGFFDNDTTGGVECVGCPSNSMSTMYNDVECTCNPGTVLLSDSESTTTVFEPCSGCDRNYYRPQMMCTRCPDNSNRGETTDDEVICPCVSEDYRRRHSETPDENCVHLVGFDSPLLIFDEGDMSKNARLLLSVPADEESNVPISIEGDEGSVINFTSNVNIRPNTAYGEVTIVTLDDGISLEDNDTFSLRITSSSPKFVTGNFNTSNGTKLYVETLVTVVDDDVVIVGFTERKVTFNESTTGAAVTIKRLSPIASALQLRIRITGVGNPVELPSDYASGVILLQTELTKTIQLTIVNGGEVTLQLEYDGPSHFSKLVTIGDDSSVHNQIEVTIIDDNPSLPNEFPLEAIIGVCAAAAGLAVLLLIIIILCLCICRLRVNRQGFYHTYEDKTSEPPTMLRYSASLRSISSQTVIPVTEGRSVSKENEFYV